MSGRSALHCPGCGAFRCWSDDHSTPQPGPDSRCDRCPPRMCGDCGQMDSMSDPCPCWISLEGMSHADLKALFAADGLTVETDGRLTR